MQKDFVNTAMNLRVSLKKQRLFLTRWMHYKCTVLREVTPCTLEHSYRLLEEGSSLASVTQCTT